MITWDQSKCVENLAQHCIDLAELESAFDFPMVTVEDDRRLWRTTATEPCLLARLRGFPGLD